MDILDEHFTDRIADPLDEMIPRPLRKENYRFCLVAGNSKVPLEKNWQDKKNYRYDDPDLIDHLVSGGNYGVVGGYDGLAVVDVDNQNYLGLLLKTLPETFTVRTRKGIHLYFSVYGGFPSKILTLKKTGENVGDLKAGFTSTPEKRGFVVGPGSIHPSGVKYEVIRSHEVIGITREELRGLLSGAGIVIGSRNTRIGGRRNIQRTRPLKIGVYPENDDELDDPGNDDVRIEEIQLRSVDPEIGPEYLKVLPLWYRTHHRKRNGNLLRKGDGRNIHLRICATLKQYTTDMWRVYAHDLTHWMLRDEYDAVKTDSELDNIDGKFYFRQTDYYEYGSLTPDIRFLSDLEQDELQMYFKRKSRE